VESLAGIARWPVGSAAAVVVDRDGSIVGSWGDPGAPYRLASVTKLLTGYAALLAIEEGGIELDDPAGPDGSTVEHLLAHASGLAPDAPRSIAAPGTRRIYSNAGYEVLAQYVADATGIAFGDYLADGVLRPLGMTGTRLVGSPAAGALAPAADLARFAAELLAPRLLAPQTVRRATTVAFPGLDGVLPGFGRQEPNDWGLAFEIRGAKRPHWTGAGNSPATYGHFGQAGTFLWVDPDAGLALLCLTDRRFGPWAAEAWPPLADAVLAEAAGRR
jgi:CubicO group peptidase (beta-lactamase class C family)